MHLIWRKNSTLKSNIAYIERILGIYANHTGMDGMEGITYNVQLQVI